MTRNHKHLLTTTDFKKSEPRKDVFWSNPLPQRFCFWLRPWCKNLGLKLRGKSSSAMWNDQYHWQILKSSCYQSCDAMTKKIVFRVEFSSTKVQFLLEALLGDYSYRETWILLTKRREDSKSEALFDASVYRTLEPKGKISQVKQLWHDWKFWLTLWSRKSRLFITEQNDIGIRK